MHTVEYYMLLAFTMLYGYFLLWFKLLRFSVCLIVLLFGKMSVSELDSEEKFGSPFYGRWVRACPLKPKLKCWLFSFGLKLLDIGDGKELDLEQCPRSKLQKQCIKYLGPQEREDYEYIVCSGKIIHKQSGDFLDTHKDSENVKWIFVVSTYKKLYAGKKKKGLFHYSSFLAGGATVAAGSLEAERGILKSISICNGYYRPADDSLNRFLSYLKENGVKLDEVEMRKLNDDKLIERDAKYEASSTADVYSELGNSQEAENTTTFDKKDPKPAAIGRHKSTRFGGIRVPRLKLPKKAIFQKMESKVTKSYQLGHQLSKKWSSGVGPRIGCVAGYPVELREKALEMLNLSPQQCPPSSPSSCKPMEGLVSLEACPTPPSPSSYMPIEHSSDDIFVN